jgi:hemin uptake protein HemP
MTLQKIHEYSSQQEGEEEEEEEEIKSEAVTYRAENLIKNGNQAHILLNNQKYTLRITRSNKLILTK